LNDPLGDGGGSRLMNIARKTRQKILIADDSELNRALLIDMLENEYDIMEV
jgi:PleD family two-component response regulator